MILPEVALPPKPIPAPRTHDSGPDEADLGRPDRGIQAIPAEDPLTPFPGGEPTEEIPLWLPPDHHAPRAGRSVVAAAKARARTALGSATVVGTDKATTPGPVADGDRDLPTPPAAQLLLDTSPGLSKFNIGTVPAPITPPPTWRRAGWFAGVSAALVLASLVAVASAVQSTRIERRTALPDYPNVLLQTTTTAPGSPSGSTRPPDDGHPARPDGPSGWTVTGAPPIGVTRSTLPGGIIVLTQPSADGSGTSAAPTKDTTTTGQPIGTVPTTTSASPPSTETQLGLVLIRTTNTDALAPATQQFFELASRDLRAAFDRFGSASLKNRGFAAFAQDFAGVAQLQVTKIVVRPVLGTTVSTMTVTLADGTTTTQHRQLAFSSGDSPLVDDEQQV